VPNGRSSPERGDDGGRDGEMTVERNDDRSGTSPIPWEHPEQIEPAVPPTSGERRKHPRFAMCIPLRLRGAKGDGTPFHETTSTEVVSAGGFACRCIADFANGTPVDVFLLAMGSHERLIGPAQVVRVKPSTSPWHSYAFAFQNAHADWFLVPDETP
jgi:PilZ domain